MNEDWDVLLSFFPENWSELASTTNALKGLRKDKDVESYFSTLLNSENPLIVGIAAGHKL